MPEPMFKWHGTYITVPELVRRLGTVELTFCKNNQSIQVRDKCGKFCGCLKYDWGGGNAAQTVSK